MDHLFVFYSKVTLCMYWETCPRRCQNKNGNLGGSVSKIWEAAGIGFVVPECSLTKRQARLRNRWWVGQPVRWRDTVQKSSQPCSFSQSHSQIDEKQTHGWAVINLTSLQANHRTSQWAKWIRRPDRIWILLVLVFLLCEDSREDVKRPHIIRTPPHRWYTISHRGYNRRNLMSCSTSTEISPSEWDLAS